jgi:hypothetical protein
MRGLIEIAGESSRALVLSDDRQRLRIQGEREHLLVHEPVTYVCDNFLRIVGSVRRGQAAEEIVADFLPMSLVVARPMLDLAEAFEEEFPTVEAAALVRLARAIGRCLPSPELLDELTAAIEGRACDARWRVLGALRMGGE